MNSNPEQFAELLKRGLWLIRGHEGKSIEIIKDELGKEIGLSTHMIDHLSKGNLPTSPAYVIGLAKQFVVRGKVDRDWIRRFFISAGYPATDHNHIGWLCELFANQDAPANANPVLDNSPKIDTKEEAPNSELATGSFVEKIYGFQWKIYAWIGIACLGLVTVIASLLFWNNQTENAPDFEDNFDDPTASSLKWKMGAAQYASIKDGRLWFDVPLNTSDEWNADVLEILMADNNYFTRIDLTIRLETPSDKKNGYIGIQTDCDKGWMMVRIGDDQPGLFVEYSQSTEHSEDFKGIVVNRLAPINTGQDYKISLTWNQGEATIMLDNQVQGTVPCLPSRYLGLFAGLPPETSVRGFIDNIRAWD